MLSELDGMRVYEYRPYNAPNEAPFITLDRIDVDYGQVAGDGRMKGILTATLALKVGAEAQERLEEYMDPAGSNSIYELMDADRQLDGNVSVCWLIGFTQAGQREFSENIPLMAATVTFGFMTS